MGENNPTINMVLGATSSDIIYTPKLTTTASFGAATTATTVLKDTLATPPSKQACYSFIEDLENIDKSVPSNCSSASLKTTPV